MGQCFKCVAHCDCGQIFDVAILGTCHGKIGQRILKNRMVVHTFFANASTYGLPPVRALFYEFGNELELLDIDRQWLVDSHILVTPVLTPGATTVDGAP